MYTEEQLCKALAEDMALPEKLYEKDYIRTSGVCTDSGRTYGSAAASLLLARLQALHVQPGAEEETLLSKASESGNEMVREILSQGRFFHGKPEDLQVTVRNRESGASCVFCLAALDEAGGRLCFFTDAAERLTGLSRILFLWAMKEKIDRHAVEKALHLPAGKFRFAAVGLNRTAVRDEEPVSMEEKQLSALLSVFTVRLFRGWHAVPVNGGLALPGEMTEAELLDRLKKDAAHPETLYQKEYINRSGMTADTREPYARAAARWLLEHREIWITAPAGAYRLEEENGQREDGFVRSVRAQGVLPPFGRVLPEELVFLNPEGEPEGKPVLLFHDSHPMLRGEYSIVRWLEVGTGRESLLGLLLRVCFHMATLDQGELSRRLGLSDETLFEGRIILPAGSARDGFLRDLPELEELMKDMGVGLVLAEEGCEAFL